MERLGVLVCTMLLSRRSRFFPILTQHTFCPLRPLRPLRPHHPIRSTHPIHALHESPPLAPPL